MIRRDDKAVLAGHGGFPGCDVVEVSVHATRERKEGTRLIEEVPGPLTLAHVAELVRRAALLGIDEGTVIVWQETDGAGDTHRRRVTGAGVRRPLEETLLAPRTDEQIVTERARHAQTWAEGWDARGQGDALQRWRDLGAELTEEQTKAIAPDNPYAQVPGR